MKKTTTMSAPQNANPGSRGIDTISRDVGARLVPQESMSLAIVDVRLPGFSGPELRERLRSKGPTKPRDISRLIDTPTVVKPFDDVTLIAAIAAAISSDRGCERHAR
jgi:DNA-binding NarL/FixJ family response regulator